MKTRKLSQIKPYKTLAFLQKVTEGTKVLWMGDLGLQEESAGYLCALVAGESAHLRQGYGGHGVAAIALPPQSKTRWIGGRRYTDRFTIGNLKSQV